MKKQSNKELDINLKDLPPDVAELVARLVEDDGVVRKASRNDLIKRGKSILDDMHRISDTENDLLRWEVAKILEGIGSRLSIPTLIHLLTDNQYEIRWLAAEGLISVGRASIIPMLEQVWRHGDSVYLREGAHHVLHQLMSEEEKEEFSGLLVSLDLGNETPEKVPMEAYKALQYFESSLNV